MKKEYEGLQNKEKNTEGWIKYDRFGYEGLSEILAYRFSKLLSTRLSFCEYTPISNEKGIGCFSKSVITASEKLVSLYSFFPEEPEALSSKHLFEYYIPHVIEITKLKDFGEWLTELFVFDLLIENEDRNPGNILLIWDNEKYKYAPVMDNANSLGYRDENIHYGKKLAKPLMLSHREQVDLFQAKYHSNIKLIGNRIKTSDLYNYYSGLQISQACKILEYTVKRHFGTDINYE